MLLSEFDYDLPENLIAQSPCKQRQNSRLMHLNKSEKTFEHKHFFDVVDLLSSDDILVINDTKVIPARLFGYKDTGALIEIFLIKNLEDKIWKCLIKPSKRVKNDLIIKISDELSVKILNKNDDDSWTVELLYDGNIYEILEKVGNIPLPPYIERNLTDEEIKKLDFERYQTVYAKYRGSVAAPTAGLHFTNEILEKLENKGVQIAHVTLNVGLGTFKPVKCDNILEHKMDSESFFIDEKNAEIISSGKKNGKNIVAVGTTSVRTLETTYAQCGEIKPIHSASELFIYPGYKFNVVDKIITNFHLPKSTLIMLVSAFAGKDFIFKAYEEAIKEQYRFYSYGDAMFIE